MAVAAAELAGAGEGAAAGSAGELSPEASSAVRSAAAGHGSKLTDSVKRELRAHAARSANNTVDVVHHYRVSGGTLTQTAVGAGTGTADSVSRAAGVRTPAGKMVVRLFVALIAFVIALEIGSYLTGRYFKWNLGGPPKTPAAPVPYQGLYKGQTVGGSK